MPDLSLLRRKPLLVAAVATPLVAGLVVGGAFIAGAVNGGVQVENLVGKPPVTDGLVLEPAPEAPEPSRSFWDTEPEGEPPVEDVPVAPEPAPNSSAPKPLTQKPAPQPAPKPAPAPAPKPDPAPAPAPAPPPAPEPAPQIPAKFGIYNGIFVPPAQCDGSVFHSHMVGWGGTSLSSKSFDADLTWSAYVDGPTVYYLACIV